MKNTTFPKFLLIALVLTFSFAVRAQEDTAAAATDAPQAQKRPNLLRELGLSREQMQAIRRINADRKEQMQTAQQRLEEARRSLDAAIYADETNDSDVEARLKEFQTAQAEIAVLRVSNEYEIRKILTPEQVIRFRELRRRFAEMRENNQQRRKEMRKNGGQNKLINRRNQRSLRN